MFESVYFLNWPNRKKNAFKYALSILVELLVWSSIQRRMFTVNSKTKYKKV